jgi:hypothetical protein
MSLTEMSTAGRLGIRPGATVWFQPIEWLRLLGPLPPGVRTTGEYAGASVAVLFVSSAGTAQWFFRRYGTVVTLPSAVWLCAPTQPQGAFNRAYLMTILAGHGLHGVEDVAIDGSWTATRIGRTGA